MLLFTRLFMCCIYSKKQTLRPFFMDRIQLSLQFSVNPGTHLVDLGRMQGWVNLGTNHWF